MSDWGVRLGYIVLGVCLGVLAVAADQARAPVSIPPDQRYLVFERTDRGRLELARPQPRCTPVIEYR